MLTFRESGSGPLTAEILRERECRVLERTVTRQIQAAPQRIDEVKTYEWCRRDATVFLVRRSFWIIDELVTTRSEQDTSASWSTVLWECAGECPQLSATPDLRSR